MGLNREGLSLKIFFRVIFFVCFKLGVFGRYFWVLKFYCLDEEIEVLIGEFGYRRVYMFREGV